MHPYISEAERTPEHEPSLACIGKVKESQMEASTPLMSWTRLNSDGSVHRENEKYEKFYKRSGLCNLNSNKSEHVKFMNIRWYALNNNISAAPNRPFEYDGPRCPWPAIHY